MVVRRELGGKQQHVRPCWEAPQSAPCWCGFAAARVGACVVAAAAAAADADAIVVVVAPRRRRPRSPTRLVYYCLVLLVLLLLLLLRLRLLLLRARHGPSLGVVHAATAAAARRCSTACHQPIHPLHYWSLLPRPSPGYRRPPRRLSLLRWHRDTTALPAPLPPRPTTTTTRLLLYYSYCYY